MTSAVALLLKWTETVRNETKYEKLHTTYLLKAKIGKKVLEPVADGLGPSDHLKHRLFFFWPNFLLLSKGKSIRHVSSMSAFEYTHVYPYLII